MTTRVFFCVWSSLFFSVKKNGEGRDKCDKHDNTVRFDLFFIHHNIPVWQTHTKKKEGNYDERVSKREDQRKSGKEKNKKKYLDYDKNKDSKGKRGKAKRNI